jgi:hypothetical protein
MIHEQNNVVLNTIKFTEYFILVARTDAGRNKYLSRMHKCPRPANGGANRVEPAAR